MACEKVLGQNCKNIQIIDKELAKVLVTVAAAEICIIRQFLDEYPKLTEKQLQRLQDTDVQDSLSNKAIQLQKKVLIEEECGCIDYGIKEIIEQSGEEQAANKQNTTVSKNKLIDYGTEELLEHSYIEQSEPMEIRHNHEDEVNEKGRRRVVLWDLPKSFEINNERYERLLQEAWVLPYGAKLTRVTVGEEYEKTLEERKKYRVIISGFHRNIAEVLLLRHMRQLKAKLVHILPNRNNNQRCSAFIQFGKREEMVKAIGQKFKDIEMQEVEENSRKGYDGLVEYYRKNHELRFEKNNNVHLKKYKQPVQGPRGNERRNIKGNGHREQNYGQENEGSKDSKGMEVKGKEKRMNGSAKKGCAKGKLIEKDHWGPMEDRKENRRNVNPERFESTWEGCGSESRIDYIWCKKSTNIDAYHCEVVDMDSITGSNHKMVVAHMVTGIGKFRTSRAKNKRSRKASSANASTEQSELDRKWKVIEEGIIQAAEETLPKKKCTKDCKLVSLNTKIRGLRKEARNISKLCRKCKQKNNQKISIEDINKIQVISEKFGNEEHSEALAIWIADLYKQLTRYWQIVRTQWHSEQRA
ncbi:432_t:CDS:10 [Gigaspora margarita]|uniref:432_t:CDS:1 n=1 Tax=Gigaspora margarita TaxID=4874 RepID=A0ABN7VKC6_GIGMA|nr:432_t:CDS:10 [Gigaspora margarita]